MAFRISVDTGGTFTDVVVDDERGHLRIGKALTSRERAYDGIRQGLAQIAPELGLSVEELLSQTEVFTYGTTRSTNAIVEGKTAQDRVLHHRGLSRHPAAARGRQARPVQADPLPAALRSALPHVRDRGAHGLRGRRRSSRSTRIRSCARSRRRGHCAPRRSPSASCGRSSNPAHELRVGELLDEHWPEVPYTLSHRLNPIIREYRRASSTAIDASLKPVMQEYLATMERDLAQAGFRGHLLISTSFGGSWRPQAIVERPIYSVGSGPSMAPVAAVTYAREELATSRTS